MSNSVNSKLPYGPNSLFQSGRYKITRLISSGAFTRTYEAVHTLLDTRIVIKELYFGDDYIKEFVLDNVYDISPSLVSSAKDAFVDMAARLSSLNNKGIVNIIDVFTEDNSTFYVMNYAEGQTLTQMMLSRAPLDESIAVSYINKVAKIVQYAHEHNVYHLNLTPNSVFIDANGNVSLTDFKEWYYLTESLLYNSIPDLPLLESEFKSSVTLRSSKASAELDMIGNLLFYMVTGKSYYKLWRQDFDILSKIEISDGLRNILSHTLLPCKNQFSMHQFIDALNSFVYQGPSDRTIYTASAASDDEHTIYPNHELQNRKIINPTKSVSDTKSSPYQNGPITQHPISEINKPSQSKFSTQQNKLHNYIESKKSNKEHKENDKKGRGFLKFLLVLLILAILGVMGYVGWQYYEYKNSVSPIHETEAEQPYETTEVKVQDIYDSQIGNKFVVVSKRDLTFNVYGIYNGDTLRITQYPVCLGKGIGQKQVSGDKRTPECSLSNPFYIQQIQDSHLWTYDYNDGRGIVRPYGPWFIRLNTPGFSGIGITGDATNEGTVPGRSSDGAIRLKNADERAFKEKHAYIGMPIVIKGEQEGFLPFELKLKNYKYNIINR